MKRTERAQEIKRIVNSLLLMMEDAASYRNDLENIGCSADAKLLDTITGKLYNLSANLQDKVRMLEQDRG